MCGGFSKPQVHCAVYAARPGPGHPWGTGYTKGAVGRAGQGRAGQGRWRDPTPVSCPQSLLCADAQGSWLLEAGGGGAGRGRGRGGVLLRVLRTNADAEGRHHRGKLMWLEVECRGRPKAVEGTFPVSHRQKPRGREGLRDRA